MADNNKRQAYIPEGALPLPNPVGTAPCFLSEDLHGRGFIISLPGVPRELEYMMANTVIPLLVERMGGGKVMKVRSLRTCAVGESNVDRVIGDLMTTENPTVGLAAHVGVTDVRIAAKANTDSEADALIAEMETKLRERLGVAIFGVEKETVPEVVGRMLAERNLKLGVIDMLTTGRLASDVIEAGFGHLIENNLNPANLADALKAAGLDSHSLLLDADHRTLATSLAESVTPANGLGLAMIGPFEENSTFIALHGPGDIRLFKRSRNYQDTDYVLRWLAIQGLDWIRRALLGQFTSPADWN
jgi:hypothetical protein